MNSSNCGSFKSKVKSFLSYINIFDIPRLTREISCDVNLIRDRYDETIKAIEDYKKELELEREKRTREKKLVYGKIGTTLKSSITGW